MRMPGYYWVPLPPFSYPETPRRGDSPMDNSCKRMSKKEKAQPKLGLLSSDRAADCNCAVFCGVLIVSIRRVNDAIDRDIFIHPPTGPICQGVSPKLGRGLPGLVHLITNTDA
jgi:hypothetical protein